jgi:eukaryotic-like serine/threonine-protein kinase
VDAVLGMAAKLADGLAHAHERGIVHRDLKPANVLLTDDGQPMLLDFNLSDDTKLRSSEAGARIGGTLPYMAPEQLSAFHHPTKLPNDGRGDLYTLGLIVYELLTGRHPFPVHPGSGEPVIDQMRADRATPPLVRPFNSAVSPAVEAIVRRCLEPDPANRYPSARDLKDDLERQLANLPLRHTPEPSRRERWSKFVRRHPRLTSATSVAAVAAAVLVVGGVALNAVVGEVRQRRAADALRVFDAAEASVKPRLIRSLDADSRSAAIDTARTAVAQYGVLDQPNWLSQRLVTALPPAEQERLRTRVGELLFLMTQATLDAAPATTGPERYREALVFNGLAGASYGAGEPPRAWWEQRAEVLRRLGERDQAADLTQKAEHIPLSTAQDFYLRAVRLYEAGRYRDALVDLERATTDDPRHYWAWLMRANCNYFLSRHDEAANCFGRCISLNDRQARAYYNRGMAYTLLARDQAAADDFRHALALDPDWVDARIQLGQTLARMALKRPQTLRMKDLAEAEAELTKVLERPDAPIRCYFQRARVRQYRGDTAGAAADTQAGLTRDPDDHDDLSWAIRGYYRRDREPEMALEDLRRAERINPRNYHALSNQAYVLSEKLHRPVETLQVLDRLVELYPDKPDSLADRAVVLARMGKVQDAVDSVRRLESLSPKPLELYKAACVYALTADRPGHAKEAMRLLAVSLTWALVLQTPAESGVVNPVNEFETDSDLDQIRSSPEFRRLEDGIRVLKSYWK